MPNKHVGLGRGLGLGLAFALLIGAIAVYLGWFSRGDATGPAGSDTSGSSEDGVAVMDPPNRRSPPPTPGADGVEAERLRICGHIANYQPSLEPAFVTASVALPGTHHPIRSAKVMPDGSWELSPLPQAPLQLGATVPGAAAWAMFVPKPEPCRDHRYLLEAPSGPATVVQGTVADAFGGPISGAPVEVIPVGRANGFGFEQPVFRVLSDEAGEFSITVAPNEYAVRGKFPGYAVASVGANTTDRPLVRVALVLSPGARVSGRVILSSDGSAVANAELRLVPLTDNGGATVYFAAAADAVSGPDGSFTIDDVEFGSWAIYAKSDSAVSSAPTEVAVDLLDEMTDVVVRVDASPAVYGVVHERGSGVPVAGAVVFLNSETQVASCQRSDLEGMFDCGPVARGTYTAIVSHEEHASTLLGATVRVRDEPRYVELELARGHTITGRVSPPAAGVSVRVRMDADEIDLANVGYSLMNVTHVSKTDHDGVFTIGPLTLGEATLVAEHLEYGRGEARVDQALAEAGTVVDILLSSAAGLSGQVTNLGETDGSTLELVLTPVEEAQRADGMRQAGQPMYTIPVATDGRFEAKGIEPAAYSLVLSHSRGLVEFTGPAQLELRDGEQTRVVLELAAQQQRFAGVVVDGDGAPVEGAVIHLADDPSNRALSGPDGEFTLAAWSDSETIAVGYHPAGYSTAAAVGTLRAGARTELVVPSTESLAVDHTGVRSGRVILTGKTRLERSAGSSGTTTITGLLPGRYDVHVCGDEAYGTGEVELSERQTSIVIDVRPWVAVRGVALDPEGAPLGGAQVLAIPANDPCGLFRQGVMAGFSEGMRLTSDDGEFNLPGLASGETLLHFIDVTAEPPQALSTTVNIADGTTTHDLGEVHLSRTSGAE